MVLTDKTVPFYGAEASLKQSISQDSSSWMFWKKRRYVVAVLAFLGFFNAYALRVNLSIAIVAMTENRTVISENGTVDYEQDFDWDSKIQGLVLSSFFYGYITTQIVGGLIAAKIGGKRVFGCGIAVTAFFTLLTPWFAWTNVYLLVAIRIVEGVFEGVTYPCIHAVWARWAPPLERTRLATLAFSGSYVGTVISMPVCAYLAKALGWPSIFYFFGVAGLVWFVVWQLVVSETPSQDPYISDSELRYIQECLADVDVSGELKHPWKSILTSMPVWAIVMAHFSENWGFYTLLTQLPKFMGDVLHFELGQTGFMSALPYLAMSITMQFSGQLGDWLIATGRLTTTQTRKVFNCGAFLAQTVFMLGAAFSSSALGCVACLTVAVGLGAFAWSGFGVNYLDVAPQHGSVLMGLGNTFGTLPGIISPVLSGYIVSTPTVQEWQIVFYITSSVYLLGCIVYAVFASGERQPWAMSSQRPEQDNNMQMGERKLGKDNSAFE